MNNKRGKEDQRKKYDPKKFQNINMKIAHFKYYNYYLLLMQLY